MATETVGGPVIIDLGLDRGEPDSDASPTRSTQSRWFAPLLIGLLVLVFSTGSTAPPPPALSPLLNLPFGPADSYAVTDAGQLLTQNSGTLSSYDLTTGRLRWQAESLTPTYRLRTGSGVVLLRPWATGPGQPSTTAISETTGAVRWQREASVVPVPGSSALLAVSAVRSIVGAGRRVEGPVESVDPRTGATRWRVEVPVTAVLMSVPGPAGQAPRMLLVHDNRTMALHDLATGRLLTTAPLPAADYGPGNPAVAGGRIVLQYATGGRFLVSAYDPVTLRPVWVQQAGYVAEADTCGVLICLAGSSSGIEAVDPATGGQRWYQPRWRSVEQRGSLLVAYGIPVGVSDLIGIVDPATGRVLVDLRGWRPLTGMAGPDQLLVSRTVEETGRILLAVVGPRDRQPRPLADLPAGTGDCQAAPGRLICRSTAGELTVWEYRLSRPSRRS
jgi:outer membrane protein assembly factor BamB